ncbi:MAG: DUF2938 domain-containing protein [Chloroflexota bacterium]|nr:DUF2938 domain-containing protein [Chloroflexota bacterium]
MNLETAYFVGAIVVGLGATLFMDLLALCLKWLFGIPLANYCLVGRWLRYMPEGTFRHPNIAAAAPRRFECAVGWAAHYVLGAVYALVLVAFVSGSWFTRPTLLPALLFSLGSLLVPFLIMQPAFGLGVAASRTQDPTRARLRSLMAHTAFGVGVYVSAVGVSSVLRMFA